MRAFKSRAVSVCINLAFLRWFMAAAALFVMGCAGAHDGEEDVGSVSLATTSDSCVSAALAGECRYSPVKAYASSVESSSLGADKAIDNSCSTRWSSQFSDPQWLKADLGTSRPLSRVIIHWESAASSSYEIQISDDAANWTKVATNSNATISGSGNSRVDTIAGLTATARYVRIYSTKRTTSYGNSVFEFEVFGTDCGAPAGCSQIPVFPASAAASSVEHSAKGPEKAIDGSLSTRWSSSASDPQWLRLDLGESQAVSRVVLNWEAASSSKYELQVSESTSGPWTTIASRSDSRVGPRTDDVNNLVGTGRYLRLYSTKRTTQYGVSLYEVKVYRQSCDACDQLLTPSVTDASSKESDAYNATKATDGDLGTRWSSSFSDPQWLRLDFAQKRRVKQVLIKWESAASKSYRLEGSSSASGPWETLAERTNQPVGPRLDTIEELNAELRYLRVYSTARTSTYGNSIYEIIVLGAQNPLACSGDCAFGDMDKDTVEDCFDACPRDPKKTSPGQCDCGTPDDDSDGDGVPNCKDRCNNAADDQSVGQCGCPGAAAPAGTPCSDGPCPGLSVCDGAGHCGSPTACPVAPNCVVKQDGDDDWYWFCPGNYTWQDARQRCAAVQGQLVTADTAAENEFVAHNLVGSSAWIGANDQTVDGQWRWANITSDGERFWNGAADGRRYFTAFSAWSSGAPAAGHACGAIVTGGSWVSDTCTATRGFVCEAATNLDVPQDDPPGEMGQPSTGPCTAPSDYFKDKDGNALTEAQVKAALEKCEASATICQTNPTSKDCTDACNGITAVPTGNTCAAFDEKDLKDPCILKSLPSTLKECVTDDQCASIPGTVCGKYFPCPVADRQGSVTETGKCTSLNATGVEGFGLVCGYPAEECPRVSDVDFGAFCDQTEICIESEMIQEKPDGFDQPTFAAVPFTPTDFFTEPAEPDLTLPFPTEDKPCGSGGCSLDEKHPWCHLGVENQLPPPSEVAPPKAGNSGGDLVSFDVDPRLRLSYEANIGPFGFPVPLEGQEHGLNVIASAGFNAKVTYDVLGGGTIDVVDVLAEAVAHECGINPNVHFSVFGVDFLPLYADLPENPLPTQEFQTNCQKAFRELQLAGDRAKKALRDAADLLGQYHKQQTTEDTTDNFHEDTCARLIEEAPRGFPHVDCNTQGVEGAINGYIEYYRRTVAGFFGADEAKDQLKGLHEVVQDFVATGLDYAPIEEIPLFEIPGRDEEVTLVNIQFFIGPVPVNLEVLSLVNYSGLVSLQAGMHPGAIIEQLILNSTEQDSSRLFFIQANGAPQAGMALAAFAGVGFSVPGFSAKLGIQSELRLANISLPVHAGAGIGLGTDSEEDRTLGADLAPPISTGKMLITPKRFTLSYEYGAGLGLKLRKILGGTIKAKLRLKVLFFSKTWSKTLLEFKGICDGEYDDMSGDIGMFPCYVPLISLDNSEKAASAGFPWGVVRPATPFVELAPLTPKAQTPGNRGLSTAVVEEFFYDGQCTCIAPGDTERDCFRDPDCCEGSICFPEPATGRDICTGCRKTDETCYDKVDCCSGNYCLTTGNTYPNGDKEQTCRACQEPEGECSENWECCGYDNDNATGFSCIAGKCQELSFCDQACDKISDTVGDEHDCRRGYDQSFLVCNGSTGLCEAAPKTAGCTPPK